MNFYNSVFLTYSYPYFAILFTDVYISASNVLSQSSMFPSALTGSLNFTYYVYAPTVYTILLISFGLFSSNSTFETASNNF